MRLKAKDVPKGEFIGRTITITKAKNPSLENMKGKIIDETKNMFVIETKDKKTKQLIKDQITFTTTIKGKKVMINGAILKGRPEERIKKKHRI